jgi:DNA integrity scanning protein DisA with diadenylate cyclase activity
MCTLTPIVHIFIEINKQIIHLMEHVNWINVITTTVSIAILLIFMYNIKNMTDEIDTLFEKLTGEISIKNAKIRELETALQNATEKWIVGKQM